MDNIKETFSNYASEAYANKWTVLFILFGILIAFSVGKTMAMKGQEDFDEAIPRKKNDILAEAICPDLKNYILKEEVAKNYISLDEVKSKYVLKKEGFSPVVNQPEAIKEKLYISMDDVKKNYMLKKDCVIDKNKNDEASSSSSEEKVIEKKPKKKHLEKDRKIQNYFDKNKENMDVPYSLLNDVFCNKKTCLPNGLPDGLKSE